MTDHMAWRHIIEKSRRGARFEPVTVLDIGSSKVCCFIAQPRPDGSFRLMGQSYQAARGIRAGEIDQMEQACDAISRVVEQAEEQAGITRSNIDVVWSGGAQATRLVEVERLLAGRMTNKADLDFLLETARLDSRSEEREVLRVQPLYAWLDNGRTFRKFTGLSGHTVTLKAAVSTCDRLALEDLLACLEQCHLSPRQIHFAAHCAGIASLSADEMERGAILIECGGGTTSLALFHRFDLVYLDQVAYGGENVTRDVAYGLDTSAVFAERLKTLHGSVRLQASLDNTWLTVPLIGDRNGSPTGEIPRSKLTRIVHSRADETMQMLTKRIQANWPVFEAHPPHYVVLSGGAALTDGMVELLEELTALPARIAKPEIIKSSSNYKGQPCVAAAAGGLVCASSLDGSLIWKPSNEPELFGTGLAKFSRWVKENFVC